MLGSGVGGSLQGFPRESQKGWMTQFPGIGEEEKWVTVVHN